MNKKTRSILIIILFFLILTLLSTWKLFLKLGFFIHRDLEWPTSYEALEKQILWEQNLDWMKRIYYLPIIYLFKLLRIKPDILEKTILFGIRFLTAVLPSFVYLKLSKEENPINSIIVGLIYSFNPIVVSMISPTFAFALSYSLLPLIFYFYYLSLKRFNFDFSILGGIFWAVAVMSDIRFLIYIPLFLLIPTFVYFFKIDKKKLIGLFKQNLFFFLSFILSSLSWLLITIITSFKATDSLSPSYLLSKGILRVFSKPMIYDVLTLRGDWWPRIELVNFFSKLNLFYIISFFVLPLFILFLIIRKKNKTTLIIAFTTIILIFLNKGIHKPFNAFYILLYDMPLFGWMFRVPSKFAFFLAATYAFSIAYLLFIVDKSKLLKNILRIILIVSIILISQPILTGDFNGKLTPINYSDLIEVDNQNFSENKFSLENKIYSSNDYTSLYLFNNSAIMLNNDECINNLDADSKDFSYKSGKVIKPISFTYEYDPSNSWSAAMTSDPLHGEFSSYMSSKFNITNNYTDLDEGLIFTFGKGSMITLPFIVDKDNNYFVYMRYYVNEQGGKISLLIDDSNYSFKTQNKSNSFKWIIVDSLNLTKGIHSIKIINDYGLNAINLFSITEDILKENCVNITFNGTNFVESSQISEVSYSLKLNLTSPTYLIFNNDYNPFWLLKIDGEYIVPKKVKDSYNIYFINQTGNFEALLEYDLQKYYYIGIFLSLVFLFSFLIWKTLKYSKVMQND